MLTLNDGRSELWQWDTGRKLTVDAECSQVHFSNKVFGRSIDVDVVDGVATIPDILLQTDKDLNAWAFVGTAENGYTKISKTFKVNRRNKPADYVFTPPEQTTLQELVKRLDAIEESQDPDAIKNAVENYLEQNPVESPVQSVNGKIGKVELTAEDVGAISQDDLQEATNEALAQAKESGDFDGDDYVLTDDDKTEIAELAAGLVKIPEAPEISMQPLTFTGAVSATYDGSSSVSVTIPTGGGTELTDLVDETLTEAVVSISYDFGEAYKYLDIYTYTPRAADNTTNNNTINLRPSGNSAYPIGVGGISPYGSLTYHTVLRCYDEGIVYEGEFDTTRTQGGTKVTTLFANGIQTMVLIPNTNGETDMIPVGTHIIIRGREKL